MVYWNMRNKTAKWVALYGMLISLAFIFSYIEAVIPIPIPVPGKGDAGVPDPFTG